MAETAKNILVVDDVPDERGYLVTVLEDAGYTVSEAVDGEDALAHVAAARPDLITLDITMPEKSGVSVYRSLKSGADTKDIPIIVVTGVSDDFKEFISSRRQVPPPDGYLSKPVDHEELLKTVEGLLH